MKPIIGDIIFDISSNRVVFIVSKNEVFQLWNKHSKIFCHKKGERACGGWLDDDIREDIYKKF